jgi:hypothetical protein
MDTASLTFEKQSLALDYSVALAVRTFDSFLALPAT